MIKHKKKPLRRKWTPEDTKMLFKLSNQNLPVKEIARRMDRSEGVVLSRRQKHGLKKYRRTEYITPKYYRHTINEKYKTLGLKEGVEYKITRKILGVGEIKDFQGKLIEEYDNYVLFANNKRKESYLKIDILNNHYSIKEV